MQSKIEYKGQQFQSPHNWATHIGQGIEEDNPNSLCAAVEKRYQCHFDLLDIFSDHVSVQPRVSFNQMATSKATPMHTSPRTAACKTCYLESDSSNEDKSDENALSEDQDREEVAEALANARSVIGALERCKSMNKDKDKTIEEKQKDSSFKKNMTQANFHNGDSLLSQASSVLPEVTPASREVTGRKRH